MADGATSGCGRWTDWVSASTPRRRPPGGPRAKLLSVAWLATARSSDLTSPQHWPIGLSWKRFPRLLADARMPAKGPPGTPVRRCSTVADRGTAWAGPAEPDNQLSDTVLNH